MGSNDNQKQIFTRSQIVQCNLEQWQQQEEKQQQNVQIMAIDKNHQSKYRQDTNGMKE